jgi:hypothetical protein
METYFLTNSFKRLCDRILFIRSLIIFNPYVYHLFLIIPVFNCTYFDINAQYDCENKKLPHTGFIVN